MVATRARAQSCTWVEGKNWFLVKSEAVLLFRLCCPICYGVFSFDLYYICISCVNPFVPLHSYLDRFRIIRLFITFYVNAGLLMLAWPPLVPLML